MIKSLEISGFQSHSDSHLDFDKGVNVIIGGSDTGKTAILRALRWLITNRPAGDSFRSNWGGKTSVRMFTDDAHIVRSKDNENEYILGDSHFKAFATDVPKEIHDALNISEINISNQFDQPFLLSDTPGEVAQYFNKIAKLDKIDQATSNVNSAIRGLEQDIKYKSAELLKQEEQLKAYDYLDKMEDDVEVLEKLDKQYVTLSHKSDKLQELIYDIQLIETDIKDKSKILQYEEQVNETIKLKQDYIGKFIEKNSILKLYNAIKENTIKLKQQNRLIILEPDVENLLKLKDDVNLLVERRGMLYKLFITVSGYNTQLKNEVSEIASLEAKFEKEMPVGSICPLCNQPIKKK